MRIFCGEYEEKPPYSSKNVESVSLGVDIYNTYSSLEVLEEFTSTKPTELKMKIEEMIRIKAWIIYELEDLDAKELLNQQRDLDRLKINIEQAQVVQREVVERNMPELAPPKNIKECYS
ncbi:hypothetical protein M0802_001653 [Mischocyttarus mexicanus]|nr:hypothetical protein M0802_001653 [Mischocyttarus mexicanus]